MIDLHTHSNYSDGSDSPKKLVSLAKRAGLWAIALTDHDNVGGASEFLESCREEGICGIVGTELSIRVDSGSLHLLGLGLDCESKALCDLLERTRNGRIERNRAILEKLSSLGYELSMEEVAGFSGSDGVVGRPHIALAMLSRGWVKDVPEAFERFVGRSGAAYAHRYRPEIGEAISAIRASHGLPVIAHPLTWKYDSSDLYESIGKIMDGGPMGIEVYHSSHTDQDVMEISIIAKKLGLLSSGGTDYHGLSVKPGVFLGSGRGSMAVPDDLLLPLAEKMSPKGCYFGKEVSIWP